MLLDQASTDVDGDENRLFSHFAPTWHHGAGFELVVKSVTAMTVMNVVRTPRNHTRPSTHRSRTFVRIRGACVLCHVGDKHRRGRDGNGGNHLGGRREEATYTDRRWQWGVW